VTSCACGCLKNGTAVLQVSVFFSRLWRKSQVMRLKSGKTQSASGDRQNMQSQIVVCYSRYRQSVDLNQKYIGRLSLLSGLVFCPHNSKYYKRSTRWSSHYIWKVALLDGAALTQQLRFKYVDIPILAQSIYLTGIMLSVVSVTYPPPAVQRPYSLYRFGKMS
jgi:hypothetical protein